MLLKIIHNNKIGAYAFMLLLMLLFWLKPLLLGYDLNIASFDDAMPLWKLFSFVLTAPWLGFLFSFLSAIVVTLSITRFNSKYGLLGKQSALPGIVFVLLIGGISFTLQFNPFWLITVFFVVSLDYLFTAHNHRKVMRTCFLAALWVSVASLFSYKVVLLFPLLLIWIIIMRLLNFKSFLAMLIGLVLPWLFLLGTELIWGGLPDFFSHISFSWGKITETYQHTTFNLIYLVAIAFIFIISILSVISAYGTKKIFTRKQYLVFIYSTLYLSGVLLFTGIHLEIFILLAVPSSIVIAHLINKIRSIWWQNILVAYLFLLAIAGQIMM
ncbi:hypothetical protein SAMN06265379_103253 [Saccharicrinis carchari]|uniref:Dolichyl-phosphate-mannose-protein mannosyltransferase n=1 Tax=Saccharicrinis carchari TaxID=1168039 RepID=A0A521CL10_SACCC|nr:DUF6427 family protein [Saccharicrinis carchari]SMO60118.1 hypothetical protein SAMN06265379_103253 [Saccharicrinis carchari]